MKYNKNLIQMVVFLSIILLVGSLVAAFVPTQSTVQQRAAEQPAAKPAAQASEPTDITLEQALAVIEAAHQKAEEQGTLMDIAVVDAGANLNTNKLLGGFPSPNQRKVCEWKMNFRMSNSLVRLTRLVCLALALNIIFILAVPAPSALACTPPPGGLPPYTVADRVNAAEVVLEGTIVALTDENDYFAIKTATVAVDRYFKEIGPVIVTIAHFGPSSLCLSEVSVGQRWIFYTTGDPATGLTAHYLSQFDAVDPATPEVIAQAIAAVGHDPVPPYGHWIYLPIILKTQVTNGRLRASPNTARFSSASPPYSQRRVEDTGDPS